MTTTGSIAISGRGWRLSPPGLKDDTAFVDAVRNLHEDIYQRYFAADTAANHALGVQLRAFRRLDNWRLLLVLTPWMLSRLLVPDRDPGLPIPAKWEKKYRADADYQVLGPLLKLDILGQSQQAHLNYDTSLGHYLLQPIALNMAMYDSAEAVFEAWNQVIRTRDENMEKHRKDCSWQKEISRRELFGRLRGG